MNNISKKNFYYQNKEKAQQKIDPYNRLLKSNEKFDSFNTVTNYKCLKKIEKNEISLLDSTNANIDKIRNQRGKIKYGVGVQGNTLIMSLHNDTIMLNNSALPNIYKDISNQNELNYYSKSNKNYTVVPYIINTYVKNKLSEYNNYLYKSEYKISGQIGTSMDSTKQLSFVYIDNYLSNKLRIHEINNNHCKAFSPISLSRQTNNNELLKHLKRIDYEENYKVVNKLQSLDNCKYYNWCQPISAWLNKKMNEPNKSDGEYIRNTDNNNCCGIHYKPCILINKLYYYNSRAIKNFDFEYTNRNDDNLVYKLTTVKILSISKDQMVNKIDRCRLYDIPHSPIYKINESIKCYKSFDKNSMNTQNHMIYRSKYQIEAKDLPIVFSRHIKNLFGRARQSIEYNESSIKYNSRPKLKVYSINTYNKFNELVCLCKENKYTKYHIYPSKLNYHRAKTCFNSLYNDSLVTKFVKNKRSRHIYEYSVNSQLNDINSFASCDSLNISHIPNINYEDMKHNKYCKLKVVRTIKHVYTNNLNEQPNKALPTYSPQNDICQIIGKSSYSNTDFNHNLLRISKRKYVYTKTNSNISKLIDSSNCGSINNTSNIQIDKNMSNLNQPYVVNKYYQLKTMNGMNKSTIIKPTLQQVSHNRKCKMNHATNNLVSKSMAYQEPPVTSFNNIQYNSSIINVKSLLDTNSKCIMKQHSTDTTMTNLFQPHIHTNLGIENNNEEILNNKASCKSKFLIRKNNDTLSSIGNHVCIIDSNKNVSNKFETKTKSLSEMKNTINTTSNIKLENKISVFTDIPEQSVNQEILVRDIAVCEKKNIITKKDSVSLIPKVIEKEQNSYINGSKCCITLKAKKVQFDYSAGSYANIIEKQNFSEISFKKSMQAKYIPEQHGYKLNCTNYSNERKEVSNKSLSAQSKNKKILDNNYSDVSNVIKLSNNRNELFYSIEKASNELTYAGSAQLLDTTFASISLNQNVAHLNGDYTLNSNTDITVNNTNITSNDANNITELIINNNEFKDNDSSLTVINKNIMLHDNSKERFMQKQTKSIINASPSKIYYSNGKEQNVKILNTENAKSKAGVSIQQQKSMKHINEETAKLDDSNKLFKECMKMKKNIIKTLHSIDRCEQTSANIIGSYNYNVTLEQNRMTVKNCENNGFSAVELATKEESKTNAMDSNSKNLQAKRLLPKKIEHQDQRVAKNEVNNNKAKFTINKQPLSNSANLKLTQAEGSDSAPITKHNKQEFILTKHKEAVKPTFINNIIENHVPDIQSKNDYDTFIAKSSSNGYSSDVQVDINNNSIIAQHENGCNKEVIEANIVPRTKTIKLISTSNIEKSDAIPGSKENNNMEKHNNNSTLQKNSNEQSNFPNTYLTNKKNDVDKIKICNSNASAKNSYKSNNNELQIGGPRTTALLENENKVNSIYNKFGSLEREKNTNVQSKIDKIKATVDAQTTSSTLHKAEDNVQSKMHKNIPKFTNLLASNKSFSKHDTDIKKVLAKGHGKLSNIPIVEIYKKNIINHNDYDGNIQAKQELLTTVEFNASSELSEIQKLRMQSNKSATKHNNTLIKDDNLSFTQISKFSSNHTNKTEGVFKNNINLATYIATKKMLNKLLPSMTTDERIKEICASEQKDSLSLNKVYSKLLIKNQLSSIKRLNQTKLYNTTDKNQCMTEKQSISPNNVTSEEQSINSKIECIVDTNKNLVCSSSNSNKSNGEEQPKLLNSSNMKNSDSLNNKVANSLKNSLKSVVPKNNSDNSAKNHVKQAILHQSSKPTIEEEKQKPLLDVESSPIYKQVDKIEAKIHTGNESQPSNKSMKLNFIVYMNKQIEEDKNRVDSAKVIYKKVEHELSLTKINKFNSSLQTHTNLKLHKANSIKAYNGYTIETRSTLIVHAEHKNITIKQELLHKDNHSTIEKERAKKSFASLSTSTKLVDNVSNTQDLTGSNLVYEITRKLSADNEAIKYNFRERKFAKSLTNMYLPNELQNTTIKREFSNLMDDFRTSKSNNKIANPLSSTFTNVIFVNTANNNHTEKVDNNSTGAKLPMTGNILISNNLNYSKKKEKNEIDFEKQLVNVESKSFSILDTIKDQGEFNQTNNYLKVLHESSVHQHKQSLNSAIIPIELLKYNKEFNLHKTEDVSSNTIQICKQSQNNKDSNLTTNKQKSVVNQKYPATNLNMQGIVVSDSINEDGNCYAELSNNKMLPISKNNNISEKNISTNYNASMMKPNHTSNTKINNENFHKSLSKTKSIEFPIEKKIQKHILAASDSFKLQKQVLDTKNTILTKASVNTVPHSILTKKINNNKAKQEIKGQFVHNSFDLKKLLDLKESYESINRQPSRSNSVTSINQQTILQSVEGRKVSKFNSSIKGVATKSSIGLSNIFNECLSNEIKTTYKPENITSKALKVKEEMQKNVTTIQIKNSAQPIKIKSKIQLTRVSSKKLIASSEPVKLVSAQIVKEPAETIQNIVQPNSEKIKHKTESKYDGSIELKSKMDNSSTYINLFNRPNGFTKNNHNSIFNTELNKLDMEHKVGINKNVHIKHSINTADNETKSKIVLNTESTRIIAKVERHITGSEKKVNSSNYSELIEGESSQSIREPNNLYSNQIASTLHNDSNNKPEQNYTKKLNYKNNINGIESKLSVDISKAVINVVQKKSIVDYVTNNITNSNDEIEDIATTTLTSSTASKFLFSSSRKIISVVPKEKATIIKTISLVKRNALVGDIKKAGNMYKGKNFVKDTNNSLILGENELNNKGRTDKFITSVDRKNQDKSLVKITNSIKSMQSLSISPVTSSLNSSIIAKKSLVINSKQNNIANKLISNNPKQVEKDEKSNIFKSFSLQQLKSSSAIETIHYPSKIIKQNEPKLGNIEKGNQIKDQLKLLNLKNNEEEYYKTLKSTKTVVDVEFVENNKKISPTFDEVGILELNSYNKHIQSVDEINVKKISLKSREQLSNDDNYLCKNKFNYQMGVEETKNKSLSLKNFKIKIIDKQIQQFASTQYVPKNEGKVYRKNDLSHRDTTQSSDNNSNGSTKVSATNVSYSISETKINTTKTNDLAGNIKKLNIDLNNSTKNIDNANLVNSLISKSTQNKSIINEVNNEHEDLLPMLRNNTNTNKAFINRHESLKVFKSNKSILLDQIGKQNKIIMDKMNAIKTKPIINNTEQKMHDTALASDKTISAMHNRKLSLDKSFTAENISNVGNLRLKSKSHINNTRNVVDTSINVTSLKELRQSSVKLLSMHPSKFESVKNNLNVNLHEPKKHVTYDNANEENIKLNEIHSLNQEQNISLSEKQLILKTESSTSLSEHSQYETVEVKNKAIIMKDQKNNDVKVIDFSSKILHKLTKIESPKNIKKVDTKVMREKSQQIIQNRLDSQAIKCKIAVKFNEFVEQQNSIKPSIKPLNKLQLLAEKLMSSMYTDEKMHEVALNKLRSYNESMRTNKQENVKEKMIDGQEKIKEKNLGQNKEDIGVLKKSNNRLNAGSLVIKELQSNTSTIKFFNEHKKNFSSGLNTLIR